MEIEGWGGGERGENKPGRRERESAFESRRDGKWENGRDGGGGQCRRRMHKKEMGKMEEQSGVFFARNFHVFASNPIQSNHLHPIFVNSFLFPRQLNIYA